MTEGTQYLHFIYLMFSLLLLFLSYVKFIVFLLAQLLTKQYHQCSTRLFPSQCLYYKPDINIFCEEKIAKLLAIIQL